MDKKRIKLVIKELNEWEKQEIRNIKFCSSLEEYESLLNSIRFEKKIKFA